MNKEYDEFKELIQDMVTEGIQSKMKEDYIFRGISGQIKKVNEDGSCTVDVVTTVLNNIKNKTGVELSVGDSVTLLERMGSNYSNCFIFIKNN